ncbi:hypothetical protein, partial [Dactylosporangium sp. NPDC051484]|uniref:hypothetical protein n=1 Tax=Dactylosporangium sp. NPDC051484 TaxID=3154942 RepID=UPI003450C2BC
ATSAVPEPEETSAVPEPAETSAVPEPLVTDIMAGPGGVMTDDVGVITGELTLRSETAPDGSFVVQVQYKEADEWYVVTGAVGTLQDPADLAAVHSVVVGILNRPEG